MFAFAPEDAVDAGTRTKDILTRIAAALGKPEAAFFDGSGAVAGLSDASARPRSGTA